MQARRLHHKDHRDLIVVRPSRLHIIDDPRPEATAGGVYPLPALNPLPSFPPSDREEADELEAGFEVWFEIDFGCDS